MAKKVVPHSAAEEKKAEARAMLNVFVLFVQNVAVLTHSKKKWFLQKKLKIFSKRNNFDIIEEMEMQIVSHFFVPI